MEGESVKEEFQCFVRRCVAHANHGTAFAVLTLRAQCELAVISDRDITVGHGKHMFQEGMRVVSAVSVLSVQRIKHACDRFLYVCQRKLLSCVTEL